MADQNNPNMMALKDLLAFQPNVGGAMPTVAPTAMVQPQLSPTAKYVADMQALMSGGIGKLSTGEKLGALGQILQAAGSRGRADPAAVIQNVRQQQMQKLNAQLQLAQLQQKAEQEKQQRAFIQKYASTLPEEKRGILENAAPEDAFKIVQEEAFRPKQVFNRDRDPKTGNVRLTFSDGSSVVTEEKMPAKTREIDTGNAIEIRNEDTNELVLSIPKQMSAYQAESLKLDKARFARGDGRGEGGSAPSYQFREDDQGNIVALNPKNPSAPPIKTGVKAAVSGWRPSIPVPPAGSKQYGR
jgi:hypothetical protein